MIVFYIPYGLASLGLKGRATNMSVAWIFFILEKLCKVFYFYFLDICNEMMDLYDSSRRKSKLREGSGSKSKDGSMTDSPAYTPSASPQVSGSPPAKKKVRQ